MFALGPGARAPLEDPPGCCFERKGIHAAARDLFKSPNFLFRRKRDARGDADVLGDVHASVSFVARVAANAALAVLVPAPRPRGAVVVERDGVPSS